MFKNPIRAGYVQVSVTYNYLVVIHSCKQMVESYLWRLLAPFGPLSPQQCPTGAGGAVDLQLPLRSVPPRGHGHLQTGLVSEGAFEMWDEYCFCPHLSGVEQQTEHNQQQHRAHHVSLHVEDPPHRHHPPHHHLLKTLFCNNTFHCCSAVIRRDLSYPHLFATGLRKSLWDGGSSDGFGPRCRSLTWLDVCPSSLSPSSTAAQTPAGQQQGQHKPGQTHREKRNCPGCGSSGCKGLAQTSNAVNW